MTDYNPEKIQDDVSRYWEENNVKQKVRESTEGKEPFFLIDGPPYLNGEPHVGHMQGKVIKDVMLRFKQMQGFDVWDQAGFDTHGLPNEIATEEELGIDDKNEIGTEISVEKFINECRNRATSAKDTWKEVMDDLAVWQDFEDPYMTFHETYAETAWWLLNEVDGQDLLYQGYKPIHWCPNCQTSLSGYEVTDEYQEVEDIAVFVRFPLENRDEKLVIWTTTPWTIPSNMAVFTHPDYRYAVVNDGEEKLIIAEQLVERVMEKKGIEEDEYEVERTMPGSDLKGLKYRTPFQEEIPRQKELDEEQGVHSVHNSEDLVTLEEGTGLVHAATGHGPEDYEETRALGLPVYSPLDEEGVFTEEAGEFEGKDVLEVDPEIVEKLEEKGLLLHSERFEHEYPHCWRCKTPLIYRASEQWFIENEETKQRMLEENEKVEWVPESAQRRFHNFVSESPDWCISRQNFWGIPVPIWVNDETGEYQVIGSFEELEEKAGELPNDFDPHKHMVDDITWKGENGGTFRRIPDVFDVWYESGIAPFASMHYPFENEDLYENMKPMDFITEASDQIRGWFYSLMFSSVLGFNERPYDKILFQGYVLDAEGEKMSKSIGNVIDPAGQVEKYGADLPRFYQLRLAPPWEQKNYDEEEIENEIFRLFNVYWNTKEFLNQYVDSAEKPDELELEDRWLLSRVNSITEEASERMDEAMFHEITRELEDFILHDLSRWYVKKVRSRIKDGDPAAGWALSKAIEKVNLLLAPFAPYVTEKVYQDLDGEKISVHAESYPEPNEKLIDENLEDTMETAREIVEKANKIRDKEQYNLRWPARRLTISVDIESQEEGLSEFEELLKDMANVKEIEYGDVSSTLAAEPVYPELGPKFGQDAEKVADLIEKLNHDQVRQLRDIGEIEIEGYDVTEDDVEIKSKTTEGVTQMSFDGGNIYLDTNMNTEIKDEALVAELLREIQQSRKEAGLEVEDKVDISLGGDTEPVKDNLGTVEDRINVDSIDFEGRPLEYSGSVEFEGRKVSYSFSRPVE